MTTSSESRRHTREQDPPPSSSPCNPALAAGIAMVLGVTHGAQAQRAPSVALEEIIVTATRRAISVQDIPYNISAISGTQIEVAGISGLADIARLVPGLQSADLGARVASTNSTFVIRGLNTNDAGVSFVAPNLSVPLVSTYIDEVPLFVNLHLSDIQRVEVLRGPQGTLYGSGSVGGTVRVIHNSPDTSRTDFQVSTQVSTIDHSGTLSSGVDTVLNLPLNDRIAWRMSAGYDHKAGFINANRAVQYDSHLQPILANPADPVHSDYSTGTLKDVNSSTTWYARNALLWKMTDSVKAELVYDHEEDKANGFSTETPGQPRYTTAEQIPVQPMDRKVDMASLTVTAQAGFATLTSATSWYKNAYTDTLDQSGFESTANALPGYYGGYPRVTLFTFDQSYDRSFVQEFRLVSSGDGPWDWIAGLFYRDEQQFIADPQSMPGFAAWSHLPGSSANVAAYFGVPDTFGNFANYLTTPRSQGGRGDRDPSTLKPTDLVYNFIRTSNYREFATYGELGYKITPAWEVTGGARVFWQNFSQDVTNELPICGPACGQNGTNQLGLNEGSAEKAFRHQIFKLNSAYKFTPDMNGYLTIAQGYRHGGANALCSTPNGSLFCYSSTKVVPLIPYKSDTAVNYELGIKGFAVNRRLRYSMALYRIDWKDIQIEQFSPVTLTTLILNGNTARTQGMEAELTAQVTSGLSFTLGYAYTDAKLTADFVLQGFVGRDGDRLPSVSKNTLSLGVDYFEPIAGIKSIGYHLDAAYRSGFTTSLNDCSANASGVHCPVLTTSGVNPRNFAVLSGYTVLNASVSLEPDEHWQIRVLGTNLTNQLGTTAQYVVQSLARDNVQYVMQPRTFGVAVRYQFR